jgi:hypothetical protein
VIEEFIVKLKTELATLESERVKLRESDEYKVWERVEQKRVDIRARQYELRKALDALLPIVEGE